MRSDVEILGDIERLEKRRSNVLAEARASDKSAFVHLEMSRRAQADADGLRATAGGITARLEELGRELSEARTPLLLEVPAGGGC